MNCPSCGGVIGRDCFNPSECAEISYTQQIQCPPRQTNMNPILSELPLSYRQEDGLLITKNGDIVGEINDARDAEFILTACNGYLAHEQEKEGK